MRFEDAIHTIFEKTTSGLLITSPGEISHYIHKNFPRRNHFYNFGAYGATLPFALGLALNTQKQVFALVGDGEALASLSTFVLLNKLQPSNLWVYVLDNGKFASTGGQLTCSSAIDFTQFHHCQTLKVTVDAKPFEKKEIDYHKLKEEFYEANNRF